MTIRYFNWLAAASLALALGCSLEARPVPDGPAALGRVTLGLVGSDSTGRAFRLRDAIIMVQGPDSTSFFDTEQALDDAPLGATVSVGSYTSFLQEGWRLEALDSGAELAPAILLSPNPQAFEVYESKETQVTLRFGTTAADGPAKTGAFGLQFQVERLGSTALCQTDADCTPPQTCCLSGLKGTCLELGAAAQCPLPDLTVSAEAAAGSIQVDRQFFPPDSCALEEACIGDFGLRRLLHFSTRTANIGDADLILGDPNGAGEFEFSACHGHFHYEGYSRYELLDLEGRVVATGHKQAFCLMDTFPVGDPALAPEARYHCEFQGLQRGWSDSYDSNLDCQWVDVTDVPDGDYLLRLSINPERLLPESNYDNNVVDVPITLAAPPAANPLDRCTTQQLGSNRECDWSFAPDQVGAACTPGEVLSVGCGCPDGTCEGDPMLRVCKDETACTAQTALAVGDDACGVCPEATFECPASGRYSVLLGSFFLAPISCDLVVTR